MRSTIRVLLLLSFLLQPALPTSAAPAADPSSAVACVAQATHLQLLTSQEAVQLCSGLASIEPAACFSKAVKTAQLDKGDAIRLCHCASGTQPVDCYNEAVHSLLLNKTEALQLCLYEGKTAGAAQDCLLESRTHPAR